MNQQDKLITFGLKIGLWGVVASIVMLPFVAAWNWCFPVSYQIQDGIAYVKEPDSYKVRNKNVPSGYMEVSVFNDNFEKIARDVYYVATKRPEINEIRVGVFEEESGKIQARIMVTDLAKIRSCKNADEYSRDCGDTLPVEYKGSSN